MAIQTVLLVDDDQAIRTVGEIVLAKLGGWDVLTAASGAEAIAIATASQPDLVLLDVMMPDLDGFQTLARLRSDARSAHIPVIFVTAKVLPGEVSAYRTSGAAGVIAKPFDPLTLPGEIVELVAQSEQQASAKP